MKTLAKMSGLFLLALALIGGMTSCKKETEASFGHMSVRMTDDSPEPGPLSGPSIFQQVNVEIVGAEVHHESMGWVTLPVQAGVYDLIDLQNDVTVALSSNVEIPPGQVTQLRLIVGDNNAVVTVSGVFDLKIPSGAETGLKLNLGTVIEPGMTTEILLDFDAEASVVLEGNGTYSLKPVLTVKAVNQF